jgi:hypothetical protein
MARLHTPEQAFRAFRKVMRNYEIESEDHLKNLLFDYVDEKLLSGVYFDTLLDLYTAEYITEDTFDEASEGIYLYYGDLIEDFIRSL